MIRRGLIRVVVAAVLIAVLASAYFFWFRDSSLVAVDQVQVEGVGAEVTQADQIRAALIEAGRQMTTLHLQPQLLHDAVARFPEVRDVSAAAGFPDRLTITVETRAAVARIGEGSEAVGVAGDGVLLPGAAVAERDLPRLPLAKAPPRDRLGGPMLDQVRVLAAAPPELLPLIESTKNAERGLTAVVRPGIELRFGEASRLAEKWESAIAVLTDPGLERLDYVDLSSPGRPAVGGQGFALPALP